MSQPYVHAIDLGYSNVKMASGTLGVMPKPLSFPAGAAPESFLAASLGGERVDGLRVRVNGTEDPFVVLIEHQRISGYPRIMNQDYPETDAYQALFLGTLLKTGRETIDLLVTGLPVNRFAASGYRAALQKRLVGTFGFPDGKRITVRDAAVIPQPVGAYIHASGTVGDVGAFRESTALVVDPGWWSFDWCMIRQGQLIPSVSGTTMNATSRLLADAAKKFNAANNAAMRAEDFERVIRSKRSRLSFRGEWVDIAPFLESAIRSTAGNAWSELLSAARDEARSADVVVLTGGGARFHAEFAERHFPHAKIVQANDPVTSNVVGFWGWGCAQLSARQGATA